MQIESVNLGTRQPPSIDEPSKWFSVGVSMARDVVKLDFGGTQQDIPLLWQRVTSTLKNSLETALASKDWQAVTVVCDSGDDLGYGATGTVTDLLYVGNSYRAQHRYGDYWEVSLTLRKYT
jgi:hypothetical protein